MKLGTRQWKIFQTIVFLNPKITAAKAIEELNDILGMGK